MTIAKRSSKHKIAAQFSKFATQYDSIANVQQQIAQYAITQLAQEHALPQARPWLDLGCGTGRNTCALAAQSSASVIGLDIAPGMLTTASAENPNQPLIQADFEALPLRTASIDVVFSSMALQWCSHPESFSTELERVLAPGGHAFLNMMVKPSFNHLRHAFKHIGQVTSVNRFSSASQWTAIFSDKLVCQAETKEFTAYFTDFKAMMQSIKGVGAGIVQENGQAAQIINKTQYKTLIDYFSGRYELDYHVLFLHLHKGL